MKKVLLLVICLILSAFLCGCTIKSGVFMGMSYNATDHSISSSYASFNGSIAQRLSLKAGDEVTFSFTDDEGLSAVVKQSGNVIYNVSDSGTFTVPSDGTYDFTVEGEATNGAFSLTWQMD